MSFRGIGVGWATERELAWLSKASVRLGSGDRRGESPWLRWWRGRGKRPAGSPCWHSRGARESGTGRGAGRLCPREPGPGGFLAKSTQGTGCLAQVGVLGAAWPPHAPVVAAVSAHTHPARPQRPAAGRRDAGLAGVLEWSGPAAVTPWGRLQASEARWSQGTRSRAPMPRCTEVPRRGSEQATLLCVTERMAACAPGPDWGAPPGRSLRGTDQRLSLTSRRGGRRHEGR